MKTGRKIGIGVLIAGVLFIVINLVSIQVSDYYFPKLLLTGIASCFIGLGFTLFPGGHADINGKNSRFLKDLWRNSKLVDKFMWIFFSLLGFAAAFWSIAYFDLNLM